MQLWPQSCSGFCHARGHCFMRMFFKVETCSRWSHYDQALSTSQERTSRLCYAAALMTWLMCFLISLRVCTTYPKAHPAAPPAEQPRHGPLASSMPTWGLCMCASTCIIRFPFTNRGRRLISIARPDFCSCTRSTYLRFWVAHFRCAA